MHSRTTLILLALFLGLAGCQKQIPSADLAQVPQAQEIFISQSFVKDNLDSIALYKDQNQEWAIATAKATDFLFVFDLNTGELVRKVGGSGSQKGQLRRPNGIWANDKILLAVERDNHRVQVFQLPTFKSLGFIGEQTLVKPYGLTCYADQNGVYQLYVTDDFPMKKPYRADQRVKHFQFQLNPKLEAKTLKTFGDLEGMGKLHKVESILADPEHNRLFIADEKGPTVGIKIYDLAGNYLHETLDTQTFAAEPEGIGLYQTNQQNGFLVATDQQAKFTVFHLYDRKTLQHLGAVRGNKTANTDGIAVTSWPSAAFPKGGLWAIHDDQALSAFDWRTIQSRILMTSPDKGDESGN